MRQRDPFEFRIHHQMHGLTLGEQDAIFVAHHRVAEMQQGKENERVAFRCRPCKGLYRPLGILKFQSARVIGGVGLSSG